jgi:hypothetical protein
MSANAGNDSNACAVCGQRFVVNQLARCCEMKHDGVIFVRRPEQEPRTKKLD